MFSALLGFEFRCLLLILRHSWLLFLQLFLRGFVLLLFQLHILDYIVLSHPPLLGAIFSLCVLSYRISVDSIEVTNSFLGWIE